MIIGNAFSLNMVTMPCSIEALPLSGSMLKRSIETGSIGLESAIGHADTARIVSGLLGVELPANRVNVKLARGEKMIVAQYLGPRLPEGATALPEGSKIEFVLVEVS